MTYKIFFKMIKAIIFDWGGVLIDNVDTERRSRITKEIGISFEKFLKIHKKICSDFQKGWTEDEYWEHFYKELGEPVKKHFLWEPLYKELYRPKEKVLELARSLHKKGYKLALLSNTVKSDMKYLPELKYDFFDVVVASCEEGIRKPEREIYDITLERLDVKPEEAVFIDNEMENIDAAKKLGMGTIFFKNVEQLKEELVKLGVDID